jgi:hypothetical protein
MMTFKIRAWALAAVFAAASGLLSTLAWAAVAPDKLYQALLQASFANGPGGRTGTAAEVPVRSEHAAMGLVGTVRVTFPELRTRVTYYVFTNPGSAAGYNLRFLAIPPRSGIILPNPPRTQCDDTAAGGGYCNLVVPESSVVIITESPTPPSAGSAPLMAPAFDHLNQIVSTASRQ